MGLLRKLLANGPVLQLLRAQSRRRSRVLVYHRIVDDHCDPLVRQLLGGAITRSAFAAQLNYLSRHYHTVSLQHLLANRDATTNMVAITFDDGYADNLDNAMPLLKQHSMPATLFVSTGFVGTDRRFWRDLLARKVASNGSERLSFHTGDGIVSFRFNGQHNKQARSTAQWLERLPEKKRDALLGDLDRNDADRFLTIEELKQLEHNGFKIEAHGVSHVRLSRLKRHEILLELVKSKQTLEGILKRPVTLLAYPFGERGDFNEATKQAAREAGYHAAVAGYRGVVDRNTDLFAIPRIPTNEDLDRFKLRLARY